MRWVSKLATSFFKPALVVSLVVICYLSGSQLYAQSSFSFLNVPNNARVSALGGSNVSLFDKDINLHTFNPALLDTTQQNQLGLSYSPYLAQSNFFTLNYAPRLKNISGSGQWGISLQNLNYGSFQGTDATGNLTNSFSANDFSLGITHARKVNNISFGITTKLVGSVIESYSALAILTDWGGTFKHPEHDLNFGIVAKNVGFVVKSYGNIKPDIPFDLQMGVSFKPKYMPARFSFTAHHLYVFDIAYNDPTLNYTFDEQGNKIPKKISIADKLLRHLTVGVELLIHKNFYLMVGYNHLRHKELILAQSGGSAGFSFGANMRLRQFGFSTSYATLTTGKGLFTFSALWGFARKP
ncbi:type IX secretion system protein PorQ [Emticicia sp. 17c]|uniref:type IX secretion system protein PorQ n=1 Tax=Emticicia sp. 17c TaxID=3127704 RepID=UPI00301B9F52